MRENGAVWGTDPFHPADIQILQKTLRPLNHTFFPLLPTASHFTLLDISLVKAFLRKFRKISDSFVMYSKAVIKSSEMKSGKITCGLIY